MTTVSVSLHNSFKEPAAQLPYPTPTLEHDSSIPYVEFDYYRFHCRIYGEQHQDTLLVLHGGPGGDLNYMLPLKELADKYQVIFFDQRGTGHSPRINEASLSLDQYIQDVDAFVNRFSQNGSLSIIGHSWGGYLALQYVARYPEKIHKLIVAAPFIPGLRTSVLFILHNFMHGIIRKLIGNKLKSLGAPLTDPDAQRDYFFGLILRQANPGYNCLAKDTKVPLGRAGYLAYRKLSTDSRGARKLKENGFPPGKMLLLAGECDKLLGMDFQTRVCQKLHYPELVEIPEAGHYLFQDNPAGCLQHIGAFLQKANQ